MSRLTIVDVRYRLATLNELMPERKFELDTYTMCGGHILTYLNDHGRRVPTRTLRRSTAEMHSYMVGMVDACELVKG